MCGIVAAITTKKDAPIDVMTDIMAHRGPDDRGTWQSTVGPYSLMFGHRRLSIIDLTPAGHQPMEIENNRYTITFNGEIYNYKKIRRELIQRGHSFRSESDTEVLLRAYHEWGRDSIKKLNGMFAFAIWDASKSTLIVARDHAGQKPLYYSHLPDGGIVLASEIKAILASRLVTPSLNILELPGYFASLRVHAPATLFEKIFKLEAGHQLEWHAGTYKIAQWWDPLEHNPHYRGTFENAKIELDSILGKAVERHMVSDVPVGAFLSGGLDSSLLVAQACGYTSSPLTTITTGFRTQDLDSAIKNELDYARIMKTFLGKKIDYHEIILQPNITELLPKITWHLDEPIADPAEINAYLICEQAKKLGITVLLSGMGADEIFAGYNHHRAIAALSTFGKFPGFAAGVRAVCAGISRVPSAAIPSLAPLIRYCQRKGKFLSGTPSQQALGLSSWMTRDEVADLLHPDVATSHYLATKQHHFDRFPTVDLLTKILYTDCKTFLSEHNLMYTDKMSMASSCEVRSPFLDREVMEFAFSLPSSWKINRFRAKYILKKVAERSIPKKIAWQKKSGFAAPIDSWRNELLDLAQEHLSPLRLSQVMPYFNGTAIERILSQHRNNKKNHSALLWSLLTFSFWHQQYLENKI